MGKLEDAFSFDSPNTMNSKAINELLGLTLADLSSFNECENLNMLIKEIEISLLRSERWTPSRIYALESLGVAQACISTFYVSRHIQLDKGTSLKLVDSVIGRILQTEEPAGFGGQQMYNTLPCLFAAAGISANHGNFRNLEQGLLKIYNLLMLTQCKRQWLEACNNSMSSFVRMLESSELTICASTVSDPDSYIRSLVSSGGSKPNLVINNLNGYWGNIDQVRKYVDNIYIIDLWPLYLRLNVSIVNYFVDNASSLFASFNAAKIGDAATAWDCFFYELTCLIESIIPFTSKEIPGRLVIPDHSLIELLPIAYNFDALSCRDIIIKKIIIARHSRTIQPITLWEKKVLIENPSYLDYSLISTKVPKGFCFYEGQRLMHASARHLSSDTLSSKMALLSPDDISILLSNTFRSCIIVVNGAFHCEASYFSLNDSIESVAHGISAVIRLCRDLFSCKNFALRARPGMNLQAQILHRKVADSVGIHLILADIQRPIDEAIASFDLVVIFHPTSVLYDAIGLGKSVLTIFKSTQEAIEFRNHFESALIV